MRLSGRSASAAIRFYGSNDPPARPWHNIITTYYDLYYLLLLDRSITSYGHQYVLRNYGNHFTPTTRPTYRRFLLETPIHNYSHRRKEERVAEETSPGRRQEEVGSSRQNSYTWAPFTINPSTIHHPAASRHPPPPTPHCNHCHCNQPHIHRHPTSDMDHGHGNVQPLSKHQHPTSTPPFHPSHHHLHHDFWGLVLLVGAAAA